VEQRPAAIPGPGAPVGNAPGSGHGAANGVVDLGGGFITHKDFWTTKSADSAEEKAKRGEPTASPDSPEKNAKRIETTRGETAMIDHGGHPSPVAGAEVRPLSTEGREERAIRPENMSDLQRRIHALRIADDIPVLDRHAAITREIDADVANTGSKLIRTPDNRLYLLVGTAADKDRAGILYDMEGGDFEHWFSNRYGMGVGERDKLLTIALADIRKEAALHGERVALRAFACYEQQTGVLTVCAGGRHVWRREPFAKQWTKYLNGEHGLMFLVTPEMTEWEPAWGEPKALDRYLSLFPFRDEGTTSIEDQKKALWVWHLALFFPSKNPEKMIPAFVTETASGKTSSLRKVGALFVNPGAPEAPWKPSNYDDENARDWETYVANALLVGIDNADSQYKKLENFLCTFATGQQVARRKYYTTGDLEYCNPIAIGLLISSRDSHFRREDVARRLLPFYLGGFPKSSNPEEEETFVFRHRGAIMGALMEQAAMLADYIFEHRGDGLPVAETDFKMKYYANFGFWIHEMLGRGKEWIARLERLYRAEMEFASQNDLIVAAVREWLDGRQANLIDGLTLWGPGYVVDFFLELQRLPTNGIEISRFAKRGFAVKLRNATIMLESELPIKLIQWKEAGDASKLRIDKK
jgi:hypothetical protein